MFFVYIDTYICVCVCVYKGLIYIYLFIYKGLPGGSAVKNLPTVQEMWVRSLGREDPLEKG